MKKNNDTLKRALEEAARIEIESLPEEKQILRPYSDKFNKEMATLIGEEKTQNVRRRPRVKLAALIAAVLVFCLTISVGAVNLIRLWSPEWHEQMTEKVLNAATSEETLAFDEAISKSDDLFAKSCVAQDDDAKVLLDYSEAYKVDVTDEKDGYKFYLDSVVKAQTKRLRTVSGSIADASAEFAYVIEDDYYLIAEISRIDGKAITEEEISFQTDPVVADFNANRTNICLMDVQKFVYEDGKIYCAVKITEAVIFADHRLGVAFKDMDNIDNTWDLTSDIAYVDTDGLPEFKDSVEGTNIVVGFNIDEKFADKEAAEEYAEKYYWYNDFGGFDYKK